MKDDEQKKQLVNNKPSTADKKKWYQQKDPSVINMDAPSTIWKGNIYNRETNLLTDRLFERTNAALVWLDVVLDKVAADKELATSNAIINQKIRDAIVGIKKDREQIHKLREEDGVLEMNAQYNNLKSKELVCHTPLSFKFITLIREMDLLLMEADSAWLTETLDRSQKQKVINTVRNKVNKVSHSIVELNTRAQKLIRTNKLNRKKEITLKEKNQAVVSVETKPKVVVKAIKKAPAKKKKLVKEMPIEATKEILSEAS